VFVNTKVIRLSVKTQHIWTEKIYVEF
jgi:hypothetical protein